jgi:hypothetical protein
LGDLVELTQNILGDGRSTLVRKQKNVRNRKIHGSTYLGAGRLVVIKVGDGRLRPPIGGLIKIKVEVSEVSLSKITAILDLDVKNKYA